MNNKKEIKKMMPAVKKINALRDRYTRMTDEDLRKEAHRLREERKTKSGDKLLEEAFALVREASRRTIGKEHYDVQLLGGIALFNGKIAEAKTGEGKTITIFLPAFLECLTGKSVYVVTVNDYLANRDSTEAAKVFDLLGVSVGCVLNTSTREERQAAYRCDITYITNSELGFDYLKDHLVFDKRETVMRGFNYAIIDEVDSILIDEAKTPLIISGPGPNTEDFLQRVSDFVLTLKEGVLSEATAAQKLAGAKETESGDYIKKEKDNQIYLTEQGIEKAGHVFGDMMSDYSSPQTLFTMRAISNMLRAHYMMKRDKDYIVKDDKVEIVDHFTGRVLPGRRFSDGLHQALEVKEHVTVQSENITIASITFQSFFNKFDKKAGLTGTAMTSAKEFKDVYNLDVVEIPTNKPVMRKDLTDLVFRTKEEKWNAVLNEVIETTKTGQPVLIGTASIADSELLSEMLSNKGIAHNTLNAKNEALEAEIIARAGQYGSVTVATNMAGRGTDIMLDEKARAAGGLKVIGTERHDSRRIDNQLKGRSGRQGDPGSSQFFISLEDHIMRVFGEENSLDTLMMIATEYGQPLQFKQLARIIEKAQTAVEDENRLTRENMMKFDEANNEYREQIYGQKEAILEEADPKALLADMFYGLSDEIVDKHIQDGTPVENWDVNGTMVEFFNKIAFITVQLDVNGMQKDNFKYALRQLDDILIDLKEKEIGDITIAKSVERSVMLRFIDRHWASFLSSMEYVRQNIGTQAYGQKDPAIEYKKRGVELFNTMIDLIKEDVVRNFMSCSVRVNSEQESESMS